MDSILRKLWRTGEYERYWGVMLQSGMLHQSLEKADPIYILNAKCAVENCSENLHWSDCCYCTFHTLESDTCYLESRGRNDKKVAVIREGIVKTSTSIEDCACSIAGLTKEQIEEIQKQGWHFDSEGNWIQRKV